MKRVMVQMYTLNLCGAIFLALYEKTRWRLHRIELWIDNEGVDLSTVLQFEYRYKMPAETKKPYFWFLMCQKFKLMLWKEYNVEINVECRDQLFVIGVFVTLDSLLC